ncbi:MAG: hypothetical protein AMXMBFR13_29940 [Phycisphaerae bacterium]
MSSAKARGPRVAYVAGAAREFPADVQHWLGQAENRAARCSSIYDALAMLTAGAPRPVALIVSISAIDWSEMEFFDHVARLSRDTRVYVSGHEHDAAKLEAACQRGARLFNAELLAEDLASAPTPWIRGGMNDLVAGSLRPSAMPPVAKGPAIRAVAVEEEPVQPEAAEPEAEASEPELEAEPAPLVEQQPPVRLVERVQEEPEEPIPFPWAPSANRPKRTPPARGPLEQPPPPSAQPEAGEIPERPPRTQVELTPEELAALMGRPAPSEPRRQEKLP